MNLRPSPRSLAYWLGMMAFAAGLFVTGMVDFNSETVGIMTVGWFGGIAACLSIQYAVDRFA